MSTMTDELEGGFETRFPEVGYLPTRLTVVNPGKPETGFPASSPTAVYDYLAFANEGAVDAQVTVQDGNGRTLIPGDTIPAGQLAVFPLPGGLILQGGMWWRASVPTVVGWARARWSVATCGV
jgi:hypothetical protein